MAATQLAKSKVGCQVCGCPVSRAHLKRHRQSQGHRDRLALRHEYLERESDRAFTIFLHTVGWSDLSAFERRRYQELKVA